MSYSIYIGEAVLEEEDPSDYDGELVARYRVNGHEEADAPEFENDSMTGKSNNRHPGYGAWADFTESVGLHDLFFNKGTGLMREHPGCFVLTQEHADRISEALADYNKQYPSAKPGFAEPFMPMRAGPVSSDSRRMGAPDRVVANYHMARLIWLDWWVRWALKNCKRPAIYNS